MIAFVIPTLNERHNIIPLVKQILDITEQSVVFVIDDQSEDETARISNLFFQDDNRVRILINPNQKGLGASLKFGLTTAMEINPEIIITMDADGSHNPEALANFIYNKQFDLVIGSRYIASANHTLSWSRGILSKVGNAITRKILKIDIKDATSGYRMYNPEKLSEIDLFEIKSNDYNFQVEILYRLVKRNVTIKEIPISFITRKSGKSKFSSKQIYLSSILLLRLFIEK
jgi:dolichol-phosphate mannosyltransferase